MNAPSRQATLAALAVSGLGLLFVRSGGVPASSSLQSSRMIDGAPSFTPGAQHGRAFYFTRAIYSGWRGYSWAIDYPEADQHFVFGLRRLTRIDAYELENPVRLDVPELRRYPFLYALEVGRMSLSEPEARGLRDYLLAGGFLVIDDFWGSREWANFESDIGRVLPGYPIVDIPLDHELLRIFYRIEELVQVPNVGSGMRGGPTWEQDGFVPTLRGIYDDDGRLMVVINWNTDLGDAWEHADNPYYPLKFSNFAYRMGVNLVIYGMTH
jgi:hypothetical protein